MQKINSSFEISELIGREISGQLTKQEQESLDKWINSSEQNRQLHHQIINDRNILLYNENYESIDKDQAWNKVYKKLVDFQRKRRNTVWIRYAAAIMIPVLFGITSYLYLKEKPEVVIQQAAKIVPGTHNAVLIMANGKNVDLTTDITKKMLEDDGTVIENTNQKLVYDRQPARKTDKSIFNTLVVPQGGEYDLVLSDGTHVFLNSMSRLVFPVSFNGSKREITLEGEAYFEVAKDKLKPFIVTIKGMKVEVLGTSFNIKAYPEDNQSFTTLVEGNVKLSSGTLAADISYLEPNQQAVFNPTTSSIEIQKVDASQFSMWTKGKYYFTNQPLDEILKTLSRWYEFKYQYDDESLKNVRFEGGLNKYESIDPILDIIEKTGKVKVTVKGKEILFSKI